MDLKISNPSKAAMAACHQQPRQLLKFFDSMASATLQPSILSLRCVVAALLWRPQRPQCARVRGLLGAVRSAMMELPLKSGEIVEIRNKCMTA